MREFGSEYSLSFYRNDYFKTLVKSYEYFCYVRTGREALALVAQTIQHNDGDILMMPAYCCRTMEWPFLDYGWNLKYYQLNDDLSINIEDLIRRVYLYRPKAVLVMNYYGFTPADSAIEAIKTLDSNLRVIEDFSHALLSQALTSVKPCKADYRIASIRKSLGVPDGGIYLSNQPYDKMLIKHLDNQFSNLRMEAEREKSMFFYSYDEELRKSSKAKLSDANDDLGRPIEIYAMSEASKDIIDNVDVEVMRYARFTNYKHLYSLLKDNKNIEILFKPNKNNQAPFSMPVLFSDRYDVQREMAEHGLFLPVLWTINDKAKAVCKISKKVSENMLSIPIDHRFDYYDIEEIAERINSYLQ